MPLLVDGHNLIGQLPVIRLDDPHDEAKLVERLRRYQARTRASITVIFDGGVPAGWSADLSGGGIRVVFSRPGVPADALILRRIRQVRNPRGLMVVTSDTEVARAARGRGIRVLPSHEFAAELDAPPDAKPAEAKPTDVRLSPQEVKEWLSLFGTEE
ncbi:MAG: NYN domain-containing protein [Anaerolineae bacterium]|nr:MAG: NYN domain-containing protein [Anaerolineae bacterium]